MFVLGLLFLVFMITTLTLTLVLVTQVRDNDVNDTILMYVEVANWLTVGLLGLVMLGLIFTTPYFVAYTRRSESIVSTGLRSARLHPAESTLPPMPVQELDPARHRLELF